MKKIYLMIQAVRAEITGVKVAGSTSKLRGSSASSTTIQDITLGTGLSMTGSTLNATGGGLSDGDKGDITVSSSGTVWTIDSGVITYGKMQVASNSSRLIGSPSGGTTLQEITLGTNLSMSSGTLNATGGLTVNQTMAYIAAY